MAVAADLVRTESGAGSGERFRPAFFRLFGTTDRPNDRPTDAEEETKKTKKAGRFRGAWMGGMLTSKQEGKQECKQASNLPCRCATPAARAEPDSVPSAVRVARSPRLTVGRRLSHLFSPTRFRASRELRARLSITTPFLSHQLPAKDTRRRSEHRLDSAKT